MSVPLLTYHKSIDTNVYDSDTRSFIVPELKSLVAGISVPSGLPAPFKLTFIMNGTKDQFERFISTVDHKRSLYILYTEDPIDSFEKSSNVIVKKYVENYYEDAIQNYDSDYYGLWNINELIDTENYIDILSRYITAVDSNIVCFYPKSIDISSYNSLIVSRDFINKVSLIQEPVEIFLPYIKYIACLSKVLVAVGSLELFVIKRLLVNETFYKNVYIKELINEAVSKITKDFLYKQCGLWIKSPKNWSEISDIPSLVI